MSDEEKEAMIELNHFSNMTAYWKQEEYTNSEIDNYIKLILNLIKKQQKEIEELKEKNNDLNWYFDNQKENFIHKDKIKAKIEEYKEMQNRYFKSNMTNDVIILQQKIQLLQSLLEKE